uniref:Uncharacterized protein n=1 Tax=Anguilla anguilla TaxID=7936 RepID=A0A0E9UK55_ANGAN
MSNPKNKTILKRRETLHLKVALHKDK